MAPEILKDRDDLDNEKEWDEENMITPNRRYERFFAKEKFKWQLREHI